MPAPGVADDGVELEEAWAASPARCCRRSLAAYRAAGSPGRRGAGVQRTGEPTTRLTVSMTCFTECGCPVPALKAPDGAPRCERVERAHVRIGQVAHVNVVAQAGAVGRRIVVAEHLQRPPAGRRFDRARNQVDLGLVVLADRAVGMRARGIEVAQRDPAQAVRALDMRQRALDRQLGLAVGVDRARSRASRRSARSSGSP